MLVSAVCRTPAPANVVRGGTRAAIPARRATHMPARARVLRVHVRAGVRAGVVVHAFTSLEWRRRRRQRHGQKQKPRHKKRQRQRQNTQKHRQRQKNRDRKTERHSERHRHSTSLSFVVPQRVASPHMLALHQNESALLVHSLGPPPLLFLHFPLYLPLPRQQLPVGRQYFLQPVHGESVSTHRDFKEKQYLHTFLVAV